MRKISFGFSLVASGLTLGLLLSNIFGDNREFSSGTPKIVTVSFPDASAIAAKLALSLADANASIYSVDANVIFNSQANRTVSLNQPLENPQLDDYFVALREEANAVTESGIVVTEIGVYPDGTFTHTANGLVSVYTRISILRKMENLPIWQDDVMFKHVFDELTGTLVAFQVHDYLWYGDHPDDYTVESTLPLVNTNTAFEQDGAEEIEIANAALSGTQKAKAVEYANKWWNSRNPAYVDLGDSDCTNFISQALLAAGWAKVGLAGAPANRADSSYWWYDSSEPIYKKSHSWADSQKWKEFAIKSGRVVNISTANARSGDIIQYDIGGNGMNHTTIVTFFDYDTNQPLLTCHSTDTHNIPLSAFISRIAREANGATYRLYAWRT